MSRAAIFGTIMRTLDFGQDLSLSAEDQLVVNDRPRLCARILPYLALPDCPDRRDQYLAAYGAERLQRHGSSLSLELLKDNFLISGGGFGPLAAAVSCKPLQD